ncbi:MAG: STAS domain-containing protein [Aestuariibacter sp.]
MSKHQEGDTRLGHDPLEWLQEDECEVEPTGSETAPPSAQHTPPQESPAALDEQVGAESDSEAQDICIDLPEKMTVQVTESLQQDWLVIIRSKPENVVLNAEHLIDADAAGVQLLFAFVLQLNSQGSKLCIVNVSEHITRTLGLAGMSEFFAKYIDAA